jgi:hypothetical protein
MIVHVWVSAIALLQKEGESEVDLLAFTAHHHIKSPHAFIHHITVRLSELNLHSRISGKVRNMTKHNIYDLKSMQEALKKYGDKGANRFELVSEYEQAFVDINTLVVSNLVAASNERLWRV